MTSTTEKKAGIAATLLAALLLVSACGGGTATEEVADNPANIDVSGKGVSLNEFGGAQLKLGVPKKGGELKLGMSGAVDSLDPLIALSTPGMAAAFAIYDTLTWVQPDGSVRPQLAKSLESKDNDNQHWTLKLRPNVEFTDGTPYNADAVIAHINRYKPPTGRARDAAQANQITDLRKIDDLTIEIDIVKPNVDFPYLFAGAGGLGMVPSPTAVAKDPKTFGLNPVGAGPFKVQSFQPGGDLVLVRNDGYWDSKYPYLDKLTMVTATDSQARLAALQAGSLDLAPTTVAADFDQAKRVGLTVLQQPLFTYYRIRLNLSKPPFDDLSMRKAIVQAIDTEALSKAVFAGKGTPMKGWFVANHPYFTKVDYPKYDPAAAKAAVAAYRAKGGTTSFELGTTASPENQQSAAVLQQMLAAVGIEVKVATYDGPTSTRMGITGDFVAQFAFVGFTLVADNDLSTWFYSTSPGTSTHAGNPELDKVIDELQVTPFQDRRDLYAKAQRILADWIPLVPLVQQAGAWIVDDKVGGFPGNKGDITNDMLQVKYLWAK